MSTARVRGVSVSLAYDGSYVTNTVYTLPNGNCFSARLSREAGRRNLVTRRDYFFGGQSIYWYSTEYNLPFSIGIECLSLQPTVPDCFVVKTKMPLSVLS